MAASGALVTVMAWRARLVCPVKSVAVSVTLYVPGFAYECVVVEPDDVAPSPKFQPKVYADVPPVAVALKVTVCPALGEAGL